MSCYSEVGNLMWACPNFRSIAYPILCLKYPFDVFKLQIQTAEDTVAKRIGAGHFDLGMSAKPSVV
jgi:hypothetical protein